jgi:hypothetical protein
MFYTAFTTKDCPALLQACGVIYYVPEGDATGHSATTNHALTAANNNKQCFLISQYKLLISLYFILWSP